MCWQRDWTCWYWQADTGSFLPGPGNVVTKHLFLTADLSTGRSGYASKVLTEMPVPSGKYDPSIQLSMLIWESCHSSSPSDYSLPAESPTGLSSGYSRGSSPLPCPLSCEVEFL